MLNHVAVDRLAELRADLTAAERTFDRLDAAGDPASLVRLRTLVQPQLMRLRRAIAAAEGPNGCEG